MPTVRDPGDRSKLADRQRIRYSVVVVAIPKLQDHGTIVNLGQ